MQSFTDLTTNLAKSFFLQTCSVQKLISAKAKIVRMKNDLICEVFAWQPIYFARRKYKRTRKTEKEEKERIKIEMENFKIQKILLEKVIYNNTVISCVLLSVSVR